MYILICDDEPAVARQVEQLARQHLEQRGIPVQCAVCTRGEEVLARTDLAQYQLDCPCRFDVAEVYPGPQGWGRPVINYIESAF